MRVERLSVACLGLLIALLAVVGPAQAHEHRKVAGGKYEFIVGWAQEPAWAGLPNGLDLGINKIPPNATWSEEGEGQTPSDHGTPFTGLTSNDLTVTYEYAGKTYTPDDFRPKFGRPGWYTASITPTREGTYTVHITGTLEGNAIDLRVDLDPIRYPSKTQFPVVDPPYPETLENVTQLQKEVNRLRVDLTNLENRIEATSRSSPSATPGPDALLSIGALASVAALLTLARRARKT